MATATTATVWSNATDAGFRAWGSWLSAQLAAMGWVLVGSSFATGTNWTDVTAPAAGNTARVTELWRMADAHQATAPLFMLLDYGETGVADTPALRIRLGTGGTGVALSGQFFDTTATFFGAGALNSNTMTHYASGDTGRFCVAFAITGTGLTTANHLGFSIERRKNAAGADLATGFLFSTWNTSTRRTVGMLAAAAHTSFSAIMAPCMLSNTTDPLFDGKEQYAPVLYCLGPVEQGLALGAVQDTVHAVATTFQVTSLGALHTYLCLGILNLTGLSSGGSFELAMRYE